MNELPLKPIHLPPPPSWWPPAIGWWLLVAFMLLLAAGLFLLWLRHRKNQRMAQWLSDTLADIDRQAEWIPALHQLLRRALCQLDKNLLTADEASWRLSLNHLAGRQSIKVLTQLEISRYQPTADIDKEAALEEAKPLLQLALLRPRLARKRLLTGAPHV
jgi:hypothetical protein